MIIKLTQITETLKEIILEWEKTSQIPSLRSKIHRKRRFEILKFWFNFDINFNIFIFISLNSAVFSYLIIFLFFYSKFDSFLLFLSCSSTYFINSIFSISHFLCFSLFFVLVIFDLYLLYWIYFILCTYAGTNRKAKVLTRRKSVIHLIVFLVSYRH